MELYDPYYGQATAVTVAAQMHIMPLMSILDMLLSKLPSVNLAVVSGMAKEDADLVDLVECLSGTFNIGSGGESTSGCRCGAAAAMGS